MTDPDVVVIGGGPAGLAAAIVCGTEGLETLLIERHAHPVDKPCGEGLLPNALTTLRRIGIAETSIEAGAHPIVGIRYRTSHGRTAEAAFTGRTGLGVRRTDLSLALATHARAVPGLEIVTGEAALAAVEAPGRPLVRVGTSEWRPKLVIGADGLHSRTRDGLGIAVERCARTRWGCRQHFDGEPWTDYVEVYFERGFEVYVTPVARGVNVAVLWDARAVRVPGGVSPVASLVARVPALARRIATRTPTDRARAAGPFDLRVRQAWRPGALLIGDAAGYLDALTGEGVGLAFDQAALLSSLVVPAVRRTPRGAVVPSAVLARFVRAARRQSRSRRQLTRLLLRVVRHPAVVEGAVAALASHDALFAHLLDVNIGRRHLWRISTPAWGHRTPVRSRDGHPPA